MIEINKNKNFIKYSFPNDKKNTRLKLLVTLSPIFIACFDNGNYELEFLKKSEVEWWEISFFGWLF